MGTFRRESEWSNTTEVTKMGTVRVSTGGMEKQRNKNSRSHSLLVKVTRNVPVNQLANRETFLTGRIEYVQ